MRSLTIAELTAETERGMSRMLRSSPMTSPTGRTVGRTWSSSGTSLTVYFSRVVTVVGAAAGGGVELCARRPAVRHAVAQAIAKLTRISLVVVVFMGWLGYWLCQA